MAWYHKLRNPEEYIFSFLKWMVLSAILGLVGGLIGTGFHKMLDLATEIRMEHTALIWALPLAGLPIIGLYHLCHLEKSRGTNDVIDAFNDKKDISPFLAPLIFIATTITHLFGGSAGREGAALQIGGTLGSILGRIFRLSKEDRSVMIVSGMSAVFAALFGTPITACLFSLEFVSVGTIFDPGLLPCLTASFVASQVALLFGVAPTAFDLPYVLQITPANTLRILIFAVLIALLSTFFCYTMHKTEHLFKHLLPNAYIRIAAGGIIVLALTKLLGTYDYNGAGMDVIIRALAGEALPWAFLLKILFTAISLGSGFKGGEIVPTFFIGATFGCIAAQMLGLDPGFGAALGMIALFCSVTNSPTTSIVLSVEMFGSGNLIIFAIVCVIGFVLSGNSGLYSSQTIVYSKTSTQIVNRKAG